MKLYRHYRGGLYRVLCMAQDCYTLQPLVIYVSVETGRVWARERSEFFDDLPDGTQRFTLIGD